MTLLYESGTRLDQLGRHGYEAVKFTKIYQAYVAEPHMSLSIIMYHMPERDLYGGGEGGHPPEYSMCVQVGSINTDANPTVIWKTETYDDIIRMGFQTINPRNDLGRGSVYINRFTLTAKGLPTNNRITCEVPMNIFEAAQKFQEASIEEFRPKYNAFAMKIREAKHAERVKNRVGLEERFAKIVRETDERIRLGTSVPEDWEINI